MDLHGKNIIITGAARGIGRALAHTFANAGAAHIIAVDLNLEGARKTASDVYGTALQIDVRKEEQIIELLDYADKNHDGVDIFCSNAGILGPLGLLEVSTEQWQQMWEVNVLSHTHVAKHCIPRMLKRGGGHIMITASAAGLLTQIGTAPYSVTKHAAVGLAEWIQITYGEQGIGVSCLCPQGVRTPMIEGKAGAAGVDGLIEPEDCAQAVLKAFEEDRFLITPHPQVLEYIKRKAADYERWIKGMQRLQRKLGSLTDEKNRQS